MKRQGWLILVIVLAGIVSPLRAVAEWSPAKQTEARALLELILRPNGGSAPAVAPAISYAVAIDGDLVWSGGLGEIAPGRLADENTVYRIGSLTKQFTAAGILRLIDDKAQSRLTGNFLSIEAPASDFLEGVEGWKVKGQAPITLHSLLTMTSNLPNYTRRPPKGLDPWGTITSRELLSALKSYRPSGWPNSFEYSNTSYFLLAEIASASRLPGSDAPIEFRPYMKEALFAPAGMTSTGFSGDPALEARVPLASYRQRPVFSHPDWLKGSADMLSTVADFYRWNSALMEGRILSAESRELMFSESARITPTTFYGMGWFIVPHDDRVHFSHTGSVAGFTSCNTIARSRDRSHWLSVTLLSNADGVEGLEQLADDLVELIERK